MKKLNERYGFEVKSGLPVARSTGTETAVFVTNASSLAIRTNDSNWFSLRPLRSLR